MVLTQSIGGNMQNQLTVLRQVRWRYMKNPLAVRVTSTADGARKAAIAVLSDRRRNHLSIRQRFLTLLVVTYLSAGGCIFFRWRSPLMATANIVVDSFYLRRTHL